MGILGKALSSVITIRGFARSVRAESICESTTIVVDRESPREVRTADGGSTVPCAAASLLCPLSCKETWELDHYEDRIAAGIVSCAHLDHFVTPASDQSMTAGASLMQLPAELLLLIIDLVRWRDAIRLAQTCSHLCDMVGMGIARKRKWRVDDMLEEYAETIQARNRAVLARYVEYALEEEQQSHVSPQWSTVRRDLLSTLFNHPDSQFARMAPKQITSSRHMLDKYHVLVEDYELDGIRRRRKSQEWLERDGFGGAHDGEFGYVAARAGQGLLVRQKSITYQPRAFVRALIRRVAHCSANNHDGPIKMDSALLSVLDRANGLRGPGLPSYRKGSVCPIFNICDARALTVESWVKVGGPDKEHDWPCHQRIGGRELEVAVYLLMHDRERDCCPATGMSYLGLYCRMVRPKGRWRWRYASVSLEASQLHDSLESLLEFHARFREQHPQDLTHKLLDEEAENARLTRLTCRPESR
ncbi:hypothetical protein MRB53_036871 [Persea americana]|nr:hypothetical protein MRB53_036871 [Persea americana]